jgi:hypothetical protein
MYVKILEAEAWKCWGGLDRETIAAQGYAGINGRVQCHVDCEWAAYTCKCPEVLRLWLRRSAEGDGPAAA